MTNQIDFEDFTKIDIRVGTIIEVKEFPKAHKPAYQLTIDFGTLGRRQSSAQITELYTKATLLNKQVTALINIETKQIANFTSECLVLGVANGNGKIVLLQPADRVNNGHPVN